MPKWEYLVIEIRLPGHRPLGQLDDLGAEGWELVAVTAASPPAHDRACFYLKRKLT